MKQYVVGLPFNRSFSNIILIRKNRPDWQAGMLNGIGGKIEAGEMPLDAMVRECQEEAGIVIPAAWWRCACVLTDTALAWRVNFYYCGADAIYSYKTMTDEAVRLYAVDRVLRDPSLMPNLRVFIPLARDISGIVKPLLLEDNTGSTKPEAGYSGSVAQPDRAVRS